MNDRDRPPHPVSGREPTIPARPKARPGITGVEGAPADCLDDGAIHALAAGTLPGEQRVRAMAHVDSCEACRDLVAIAALAEGADEAPGYQLGRELARGGMGRVVLAQELVLGREVVIKQLLDDSPDLRRRFEREARITARLQHPGIVPVYQAGRLKNGEPFYAMRRIHGRSLDLEIAAATTMAARLALVPRLLVAIQAVAYAHTQHVIHRDLKPHNILVGEFGDVVVVDWGLAKQLDGDEDEAATTSRGDLGEGALTQVGSVLGTPAYMAPEQANGEPADRRSDVYALGAVLYHLLGGAPPHTGSSAALLLAAIDEGAIVPLPSRAPEVPADLAAIVARCLARDPDARYPDAAALAAEVQTFLHGKLVAAHAYSLGELLRRWLRRHRAAVLASCALAVGLAVITAVAFRRVSAERDRARTQQAASESLVGFVLDDLQPRVRDLRKLVLLEGVSEEVDRYYQALDRAGARLDGDSLLRWATAGGVLGDVAFERAELAASRARYEDARAHLDRASGLMIVRPPVLRRLALVHARLGRLASTEDRVDDAAAEYERSLALYRGLPDPDPTTVGEVLVQMGRLEHVRGRRAEAVARYGEARDWLRRFPDDHQAQRQLLAAIDALAVAAGEDGRLVEALELRRENLTLAETLAKEVPSDLDRRFDLAEAQGEVGLRAAATGDDDGARTAFEGAIAILTELVAHDPDNQAWRASLARQVGRLGSAEYSLERDGPARAAFARALSLWSELHRQSPDNGSWRAELAAAHYWYGIGESAVDDLATARAAFAQAIALIRDQAELNPSSANYLVTYLGAAADSATQVGAHAEALAAVDEAMALVRRWNQRESSPRWLAKEATLWVSRAAITRATHDRPQTLTALRSARDLYRRYQTVASLKPWQRDELERVETELAPLER